MIRSPRSSSSSTTRSSLLSALLPEEDCLTATMQHGRVSRNAGHRGRRNADPFAVGAFDDPEDATTVPFAAVSSTLLPSLADRVSVPRGEQRWLRFNSRGRASYIKKIDKHALVTSLQLPARDLVMVNPLVPVSLKFFFFLFRPPLREQLEKKLTPPSLSLSLSLPRFRFTQRRPRSRPRS